MSNLFKSKKLRTWGFVAVIALLALALVKPIFFSGRASAAAAKGEGKVTSLNVAETVEATGSLEAQLSANLTWRTAGVVEEVYVKAGDKVKAGDVLMKLKTSTVDASVISGRANLVTAQQDLEDLLSSSDKELSQAAIDLKDAQEAYDKSVSYLEYLQRSNKVAQTEVRRWTIQDTRRRGWEYEFKTKVIKGPAPEDWVTEAENDLALKEAQLEDTQRNYDHYRNGPNAQDIAAAQAKVDAAQATVDTMSVTAPFDGEVLYVASQPNDMVSAGSAALNMANLDHLYIETQIDESDIANVKAGDLVTATLDAAPDLQWTGNVAAIDSLGEVESGSVQYTVRIDLDQAAKDVFLPLGATANVTIQTKPAATSLAVPITSIQNDSRGEYVLVVQPDGSTKRVDIISGSIVGDQVVVSGDLKAGDLLTTSPKSSVRLPGPFGGAK